MMANLPPVTAATATRQTGWSTEELDRLDRLVEEEGWDCARLVKHFPGRSRSSLRGAYHRPRSRYAARPSQGAVPPPAPPPAAGELDAPSPVDLELAVVDANALAAAAAAFDSPLPAAAAAAFSGGGTGFGSFTRRVVALDRAASSVARGLTYAIFGESPAAAAEEEEVVGAEEPWAARTPSNTSSAASETASQADFLDGLFA